MTMQEQYSSDEQPLANSREVMMYKGSIFGFLALATSTLGIWGLIELGSPNPVDGLIKIGIAIGLGYAANHLWQDFGNHPHTE
jgi:hypothetical protein